MKRIALFAHFDADAVVRPYVLHFLKALRTVASDIFFVSTSPLTEAELDKVRPYCSSAITKENVGFDFGMWSEAMKQVDLDSCDALILSNSSVFGPLSPLAPIFERMKDADVWGMTDNVEIAWHLQSYFLVFGKRVLASPAFRQFWQTILPYRNKEQVIRSYEIGLSTLLVDQGFSLKAFVPIETLRRPLPPMAMMRRNITSWWKMLTHDVNPTCSMPAQLLRAGMPFVKLELLRDNPLFVPLEPVLELMKESGWDMSMIEFDRRKPR
jgi:rhamnosyltransferase